MSLAKWQAQFLIGGAAILPVAPFLFLQGQLTRWKVGVFAGSRRRDKRGLPVTADGEPAKLFVIGESTVAGLGARTHELAFGRAICKATERSGSIGLLTGMSSARMA